MCQCVESIDEPPLSAAGPVTRKKKTVKKVKKKKKMKEKLSNSQEASAASSRFLFSCLENTLCENQPCYRLMFAFLCELHTTVRHWFHNLTRLPFNQPQMCVVIYDHSFPFSLLAWWPWHTNVAYIFVTSYAYKNEYRKSSLSTVRARMGQRDRHTQTDRCDWNYYHNRIREW